MNLDQKYSTIDLEDKVNPRQWIPVVGLAQVIYDQINGKPALFDYDNPRFLGSAVVHGAGLAGLAQLIHYFVR